MILLDSKEQALVLKKVLNKSYDSDWYSPEDKIHIKELIEDADTEIKVFERKEIGPLMLKDLKLIKEELLNAVVNGMPSDLAPTQQDDWFYVTDRKQTCWNWRHAERPAMILAEIHGLKDKVNNTPGNPLYKITEWVKRHKDVKAIKARAK